jgi:hypothetical protein
MVLENTVPIFKFLLCDLPSLCLVLGQEVCDELIDENGVPMPKFGGRGGGQHFLKVLRSMLWLEVPLLEGVPHGSWPTPENTLLIDDNTAKSLLCPLLFFHRCSHFLASACYACLRAPIPNRPSLIYPLHSLYDIVSQVAPRSFGGRPSLTSSLERHTTQGCIFRVRSLFSPPAKHETIPLPNAIVFHSPYDFVQFGSASG